MLSLHKEEDSLLLGSVGDIDYENNIDQQQNVVLPKKQTTPSSSAKQQQFIPLSSEDLHKHLHNLKSMFDVGDLSAVDFVGAFVILHSWYKLSSHPYSTKTLFARRSAASSKKNTHNNKKEGKIGRQLPDDSTTTSSVPQDQRALIESLFPLPTQINNTIGNKSKKDPLYFLDEFEKATTRRKPPVYPQRTIQSIFEHATVFQVPACVNECITKWCSNLRPAVLLFHIPSVKEVFEMQAAGMRCITAMVPREPQPALATIPAGTSDGFANNKLDYKEEEKRAQSDPLAFLVHDICHMENFVDSELYLEQVGFVNMLAQIPRQLVAPFADRQYRLDMDHLKSDMNGCSSFMFAYFKHKLMLAVARKLYNSSDNNEAPPHPEEMVTAAMQSQQEQQQQQQQQQPKSYNAIFSSQADRDLFYQVYTEILDQVWHLEPEVREAAMRLCTEKYAAAREGEILRRHCQHIGRQSLQAKAAAAAATTTTTTTAAAVAQAEAGAVADG